MGAPRIVLIGLGAKVAGLRWEFEASLRIGRQPNVEVMLRDTSVDRLHAEVKNGGGKWVVRDRASSAHYPTLLNGRNLAGGQHELRLGDVLQLGRIEIKVDALALASESDEYPTMRTVPGVTPLLPVMNPIQGALSSDLKIDRVFQHSWDEAFQMLANDGPPQLNPGLIHLLRANRFQTPSADLDQVLHGILEDTVQTLGAQRGVILLAEPGTEELRLRALWAPGVPPTSKRYSRTLTERCWRSGESLLCHDVHADEAMLAARNIRFDTMASVLCVPLRTPRQRLGVLHLDRGPLNEPFAGKDLLLADALAASVATGIECAQVMGRHEDELLQTVSTIARAADLRDQAAGGRPKRVTDYAVLLGDELQVSQRDRQQLQIGGLVYDIGNIGVAESILRKPGKLTAAEFDAMKSHTIKGAALLEGCSALQRLVPMVRHHHERWDGTGYPDGLRHDQIALSARIMAVADAFDAMTSPRPYRPALPLQAAYREVLAKAGTHFDPTCVQAFLRARGKIEISLSDA